MEELEARLRALARRKPLSGLDIVKYGPLSFDRAGRKLSALNKEIVMPRKELSIFECFFEHQNQIVSKAQLADYIYGVGSDIDQRVIETHISRLRKKLLPHHVTIKVARGLGYMMHVKK